MPVVARWQLKSVASSRKIHTSVSDGCAFRHHAALVTPGIVRVVPRGRDKLDGVDQ